MGLAGPGSGRVVLRNLTLIGRAANGIDHSTTAPVIDGGGFERLEIEGCTVVGSDRVPPITGDALGAPALRTTIPDVLIRASHLKAGKSLHDHCFLGPAPAGQPAIDAPESTLLVLDSIVTGGDSPDIAGCFECPSAGGSGGTGIVAADRWHSGSTITAGRATSDSIESAPETECGPPRASSASASPRRSGAFRKAGRARPWTRSGSRRGTCGPVHDVRTADHGAPPWTAQRPARRSSQR